MVEQRTENPLVGGSSPPQATILKFMGLILLMIKCQYLSVKPLIYKNLSSEYVTLKELQPYDIDILYNLSHNSSEDKKIWDYMLNDPFTDSNSLWQYYQKIKDTGDLVFCVYNNKTNLPIGVVCLMDIQLLHGSVEFGRIWYAKEFHGTNINTEAIYLLLTYCIDDLGFRRIIWKCDNDNQKSKSASIRLGFTYEGLFEDHMLIVKNNVTYIRDTAFYRLLTKDWQLIKQNYITYLYDSVTNKQSLTDLNFQSLPRNIDGSKIITTA